MNNMIIFRKTIVIILSALLFASALMFSGLTDSPALVLLRQYEKSKQKVSVVVIGDSRCHSGVDPEILEQELRLSEKDEIALNLCVDGTDVLHHLSLIRSIFKLGYNPKYIIWAIHGLQFSSEHINNRIEYLNISDIGQLWSAHAPIELILDVITGTIYRPWAYRPRFKNLKSDYMERLAIRLMPIQNFMGLSSQSLKKARKYYQRSNGFMPFTILDWKERYYSGLKHYDLELNKFKAAKWRLNLIDHIIEYVKKNETRLMPVELPVSEEYLNKIKHHAEYQHWRENIKNIFSANDIKYLDHTTLYRRRRDSFGDPGHFSIGLSREYSRSLSAVIRSYDRTLDAATDNTIGDL